MCFINYLVVNLDFLASQRGFKLNYLLAVTICENINNNDCF